MSARSNLSLAHSSDAPFGPDDRFLREALEVLERLRSECEWRGHPLLASLLDIARSEAEDDLKTCAETRRFSSGSRSRGRVSEDESVLRMAEKLACRTK